jgi:hypothetical protein
MVPTGVLGWYKGYYEADRVDKAEIREAYEKGYEVGYLARIKYEVEEKDRHKEVEAHIGGDGWSAVGGCSEHTDCCVRSNLNSGVVTHEPIVISDEERVDIMPRYNLKGE